MLNPLNTIFVDTVSSAGVRQSKCSPEVVSEPRNQIIKHASNMTTSDSRYLDTGHPGATF